MYAMRYYFYLAIILFWMSFSSYGAGKLRITFPSEIQKDVHALSFQQKKVVVGGAFSPLYIARVQEDGTMDYSFYTSWKMAGFNQPVYDTLTLSDQTLVVGGAFSAIDTSLAGHIAKFSPAGEIDVSFLKNTGTGFDQTVNILVQDTSGKVLVVGDFNSFNGTKTPQMARLLASGVLDANFHFPGVQGGVIKTLLPQSDGTIWIGGTFQKVGSTSVPYFACLDAQGKLKNPCF